MILSALFFKIEMKKILSIFSVFLLLCSYSIGQSIDASNQVKLQIEELYDNNDIIAINRLVNRNTFLDPEYAFEIINQNLSLAVKNDDQKQIADTYLTLGNFWFTQGNFTKAFDFYLKSESIGKKIKDYRLVGLSIMNRSNIPNDLNAKIDMLHEAVDILRQSKDTLNLAKAHLNLGNNYSLFVLDNPESSALLSATDISTYRENAFEHFTKAVELNHSLQSPEISASINLHFGEWYKFQKDYTAARESFHKAEGFFLIAGRTKGKVYCLQQLAEVENEDGNNQKALEYLATAEELSKEFEYNDYLVEIYDQYQKLYKSTGNDEKALEYFELFHKYSTQLNELNSQDKIHLINLESNLVENEYLLERAESQKNIFRIISVTSLIFLGFIIGFAYLIIRNKKRKIGTIEKNKIITEIKLKNKELEEELLKEKVKFSQDHLISFANQVNQIEDFLEEIKVQLKNTPNHLNSKNINALKMSFSEIVNDQTYLKQLNSLSTELNQDFFLQLRKQNKKLSKNDEQLLSFLILEMSSKEIGSILNISTESVYTKRYRLRKKLNIYSDLTFMDYYKKTIESL